MNTFAHQGINLSYHEAGDGVPFIFQHGLGGDASQTFGLFHPPKGIRMITLECRAHGQSPVGPPEQISLATYRDDLLALLDHLKIEKAIVGGISMGAAITLSLAIQHPARALGLILDRVAWLDGPRRDNIAIFSVIATLIRRHGAAGGLERFQQSEFYQKTQAESPAAAKSLSAHFLHPRAEEAVARLERIPIDTPGFSRRDWRAIAVPTLVLASGMDAIHPFSFGVTFAREIPGAEFKELTPKSVDAERHQQETQRFIEDFLIRNF